MPTTILVPHTKTAGSNGQSLNLDTVRLLAEHAPDDVPIEWREIDPARTTQYAEILQEAWLWPGDLIVVEHDILVPAGFAEGFQSCRQPWCSHPYPGPSDMLINSLGCVRFTAHLKTMQPDLMARAVGIDGQMDGGLVPAGDWRRMDTRIACLLQSMGHVVHPHDPPAGHKHYPNETDILATHVPAVHPRLAQW